MMPSEDSTYECDGDCGLFANAFATALFYSKQPGELSFNQPKMCEKFPTTFRLQLD